MTYPAAPSTGSHQRVTWLTPASAERPVGAGNLGEWPGPGAVPAPAGSSRGRRGAGRVLSGLKTTAPPTDYDHASYDHASYDHASYDHARQVAPNRRVGSWLIMWRSLGPPKGNRSFP